MSKKKQNETVEKLDVESLIVDLLCCGLGGCVILFFIFAIKIIGPSFAQTRAKSGVKEKGVFPGFVSLIGDDGHGTRMGAFRIVHLYKLSDENLEAIKKAADDPQSFWDLSDFDRDKELRASVRTQVEIKKNDVSFFLSADGMREVEFIFPTTLRQQLKNSRPGNNGLADIIFLEGQSVKGDFNGYYKPAVPVNINNIQALSIKFKIGKVSSIDRLIEVLYDK